jgi:hypothetical protein
MSNNTSTRAPERFSPCAVFQKLVKEAEDVKAEFLKQAAKNGPRYAISWHGQVAARTEIAAGFAKEFIGLLEQNQDDEAISSVLAKMKQRITKRIRHWSIPGSHGFHYLASVEEFEALKTVAEAIDEAIDFHKDRMADDGTLPSQEQSEIDHAEPLRPGILVAIRENPFDRASPIVGEVRLIEPAPADPIILTMSKEAPMMECWIAERVDNGRRHGGWIDRRDAIR